MFSVGISLTDIHPSQGVTHGKWGEDFLLRPGEIFRRGRRAAPGHFAYTSKITKKLFDGPHVLISQGTANTSAEHFMGTVFRRQGLIPQG